MNTKIFSALVPKVNELSYYKVTINFGDECLKGLLSYYNRQKIAARQIAETREDVLVAPMTGKASQIHVIILTKSSESNPFGWTKDMNLILSGPFSLHQAVYLECIYFTLTVRLSLRWRRIQNYFIKPECFLNHSQVVEVVKLDLMLTDARFIMSLTPMKLKIPTIDFDEMKIDFETFRKENFVEVCRKVYVLPDLKPATAFKVHAKLPDFGQFNEYSKLRYYWKILHGYQLQENENNMLYVEVKFEYSDVRYIYPISCVLSHEPLQLPCKNEVGITNEFLASLKNLFPLMRDHVAKEKPEAEDQHFPEMKFHLASEVLATQQYFERKELNTTESRLEVLR